MLVMPDTEDPFVPLGSDGLFVDPYESQYAYDLAVDENKGNWANVLGLLLLVSSHSCRASSRRSRCQSLHSYPCSTLLLQP